jgi:hypothetical protein
MERSRIHFFLTTIPGFLKIGKEEMGSLLDFAPPSTEAPGSWLANFACIQKK